MIKVLRIRAGLIALVLAGLAVSAPTVYPTGTTIYDPERAWNGFTVLSSLRREAVIVIDMNGEVVKEWSGFVNSAGGPARVLPGGIVAAAVGANPPHQESLGLEQRSFEGERLWSYRGDERIETAAGETLQSARQHHDWQRKDLPAGYYSPDASPGEESDILVLSHSNVMQPEVAEVMLEDDRLVEVAWDGEILWDWRASDHIGDFGFSNEARAAIAAGQGGRAGFDWFHINSATYVGPNRWFDAGDTRFAPDNVIVSSRQASIVAIIDRAGDVVWQLGPDFSASEELQALGQIIGQHHAHFIPEGLPGAGNVMIFDNGGSSGYGAPNSLAADGVGIYQRAGSRVLEIDPVTLELQWSYSAPNFFSTNISSAQRLPNGNTLITEGAPGRMFEVTAEGETVWEYMSPFFGGGPRPSNAVYRAYRVPYEWIPQLLRPDERAVVPPALEDFRLE